jgi:hypothetical protein
MAKEQKQKSKRSLLGTCCHKNWHPQFDYSTIRQLDKTQALYRKSNMAITGSTEVSVSRELTWVYKRRVIKGELTGHFSDSDCRWKSLVWKISSLTSKETMPS